MSHELRTPLNSMLLLSNLLSENTERNLTDKQVEFSKTIHSAGKDLLTLINQVLDLAKIEAGKQEVFIEGVTLAELIERTRRVFGPLATDKGLGFTAEIDPAMPATIQSDRHRVDQILTNLLGNAIKFTEQGRIALRIGLPARGTHFERDDLLPERAIALAVSDTGIGIAPHEQERVFAPFQQIDARTDRRYGGTGLGLSIARELAVLLGGELQLDSAPGRGSTFTCYLPMESPLGRSQSGPVAVDALEGPGATRGSAAAPHAVGDDRATLKPDEPHLLIIEDDATFAGQLADIIHARNFKVIVASHGRGGLQLAKQHRPQGIILDIKLPDIDGWTVMEHLGFDTETRRIPVHFVSSLDAPERGLAMGAVGYLTKPATHEDLIEVVETLAPQTIERSRRILVVEDDTARGQSLLSNAIKFTAEGGTVTLAARVAADRLSIAVSDTGVGISPEDMPRLFREFERIDNGSRPMPEGTGLGLALTKRLVELHGGRIDVRSEPGKGTTFTVEIPLMPVPSEPRCVLTAAEGGDQVV